MYIIDDSYFTDDKFIPNLGIGVTKEDINPLIDGCVHDLLESVLGTKKYLEFTENLTEEGELKPDASQEWINLINGCEYEYNEEKHYFKGLIFKRGAYKNSLLAYYVFYKWLKNNVSKTTGIGEVVISSKNAVNVGLTNKVVETWNKFWSLLSDDYHHNGVKYVHYGVPIYDYSNHNKKNSVSLFRFLKENSYIYGNLPLDLPLTDDKHGYRNKLGL